MLWLLKLFKGKSVDLDKLIERSGENTKNNVTLIPEQEENIHKELMELKTISKRINKWHLKKMAFPYQRWTQSGHITEINRGKEETKIPQNANILAHFEE